MSLALLFPGQGSQFIGMGKDFSSKFTVANQLFSDLDQILGRSLTEIMFDGNIDELTLTTNSQPAIMAVSSVILESIRSENLINFDSVEAVAGHSLGEYSALYAANSISFISSIQLLEVRSRAMQESMPVGTGGMAAIIGKSMLEVEDLLDSIKDYGQISIANDNADGQIVVSGEMSAINHLCDNSKELGVKRALKLPVSAPFHCDLIQSASKELSKVINKYEFNEFKYDFYSNVTSEQCSNIETPDLLVRQIVSRVRWREIIENMIKNGISTFIEIGPGNVLSNLVKRINKSSNTLSISKVEDLEKLNTIALR
jgi:[acyl-carrier-protein] S-malonyltransferase